MIIDSLELLDFRNYEREIFEFSRETNVLYGDNAQGKTNVLEGIYLCSTTRSHKGSKDKEMIIFGLPSPGFLPNQLHHPDTPFCPGAALPLHSP